MAEKILSLLSAQRFYDRIGSRYDWFEFYEGHAKEMAREALHLTSGLKILSVGAGTGKELQKIIPGITPGGIAFAVDISTVMLELTRKRTSAKVCQADARRIPFTEQSFDRVYAAYVLDLISKAEIPGLLLDFFRVLKPSGRLVILALTEGINLSSRAIVSLWKGLFSISPTVCGGCRPLELLDFVKEAGFSGVKREVIVQMGVPSEIILGVKV